MDNRRQLGRVIEDGAFVDAVVSDDKEAVLVHTFRKLVKLLLQTAILLCQRMVDKDNDVAARIENSGLEAVAHRLVRILGCL